MGTRQQRWVWLVGGAPALALAMACSAGCDVSPQPETLTTCGEEPSVDPIRLRFESTALGTTLIGSPLAVYVRSCSSDEPQPPEPGEVLRSTDLDSKAPPAATKVSHDGSFEIAVGGVPTHVYRVGVVSPKARPVDVTVTDDGLIEVSPCLEGAVDDYPNVPTGASEVIEVTLTNDCGHDVSISDAALRDGTAGFSLGSTPLGNVPAASSVVVEVTYQPLGLDPAEDILLVRFAEGPEGRAAVTLRAQPLPE